MKCSLNLEVKIDISNNISPSINFVNILGFNSDEEKEI